MAKVVYPSLDDIDPPGSPELPEPSAPPPPPYNHYNYASTPVPVKEPKPVSGSYSEEGEEEEEDTDEDMKALAREASDALSRRANAGKTPRLAEIDPARMAALRGDGIAPAVGMPTPKPKGLFGSAASGMTYARWMAQVGKLGGKIVSEKLEVLLTKRVPVDKWAWWEMDPKGAMDGNARPSEVWDAIMQRAARGGNMIQELHACKWTLEDVCMDVRGQRVDIENVVSPYAKSSWDNLRALGYSGDVMEMGALAIGVWFNPNLLRTIGVGLRELAGAGFKTSDLLTAKIDASNLSHISSASNLPCPLQVLCGAMQMTPKNLADFGFTIDEWVTILGVTWEDLMFTKLLRDTEANKRLKAWPCGWTEDEMCTRFMCTREEAEEVFPPPPPVFPRPKKRTKIPVRAHKHKRKTKHKERRPPSPRLLSGSSYGSGSWSGPINMYGKK